jgi:hypothetical protein
MTLTGEQMCTLDGACIDGLRDEQASDRQVPYTRGGTRTDPWNTCLT